MTGRDVQIRIRGMHCAACVSSVEKALGSVDRVTEASVSLVDEVARVSIDEAQPSEDRLLGDLVAAVE
ncbi:MAG: heavy-metal-associated domain-containing protein, partial [Longimicrobiales bacterium]